MTNAYPTAARTLTFNREDWSGEDITIEVKDGNRFEFNGYDLRLVDVTPKVQDDKPGDRYYFRKMDIVSKGDRHPLGEVAWFDGSKTKTASETNCVDAYYQRRAVDPVEAAVKMLCNTL